MLEDAAVTDAPLAAAADAPALDTPAVDTPDTGAPEAGEEPAAETPAAPDAERPAAAAEGAASAIVDGKRLSEAAKATLAEIKARDPRLAAQIKSALFEQDALRRAVPGGLKEVSELRTTLETLGGKEGIARLEAERAEWTALDEQYIRGDARFIESIATTNPEAFQKLAPAAFQKFAELNPEGYAAYMGQVFVADLQQEGIPLALERLQDFISDNPRALEVWKKLAAYVNRVGTFASKSVAPAASKAKPEAADERERAIAEREATLTRTEWRAEADRERLGVYQPEWKRLTEGRKISDDQRAAIEELYVSRLAAALKRNPNFNSTIDRYFQAKDRAAYVRYMASIYKQEIPRALRSAIDSVLPAKPGPAKSAAPAQAAAPNAAPGQPASGYTWAAAAPPKDQIDVTRTTMDMIREGRAVLLGGKRVQWKK